MKVVIIGAGNLATNLAVALQKAGHSILQICNRTLQSAIKLAERVGAVSITDLHELDDSADIYFIAISDSAITQLDYTCFSPSAFVVHTAGSVSVDAIPLSRRGVFYPMQTFSRQRVVDFSTIPLFLETAHPTDMSVLESLAHSISSNVYILSSADRLYLHLAAVFCSNFVNHCYAMSESILQSHGLQFSVMLPLIDEVAQKVHDFSPKEAQTGPACRHDFNVIDHHLKLLSNLPDYQQLYLMMSTHIASVYPQTLSQNLNSPQEIQAND